MLWQTAYNHYTLLFQTKVKESQNTDMTHDTEIWQILNINKHRNYYKNNSTTKPYKSINLKSKERTDVLKVSISHCKHSETLPFFI